MFWFRNSLLSVAAIFFSYSESHRAFVRARCVCCVTGPKGDGEDSGRVARRDDDDDGREQNTKRRQNVNREQKHLFHIVNRLPASTPEKKSTTQKKI